MAAAGIGAGSQGLSDMASSGLGAYFANRESNQAWQRQKQIMKSRYQWMVGDLKAAGLNPILAVQGMSPGSGSPPTTAGVVGRVGNYAASAREAALLGAQLKNIEADTKYKESLGRGESAEADAKEVLRLPFTIFNNVNSGWSQFKSDMGREPEMSTGAGASDQSLPALINSGRSALKALSDWYMGGGMVRPEKK